MMKLSFLGTGTSCGVPTIGCECYTCTSTDPHDKRLRCSLLVETGQTRLLIDCGPDFRQQMLAQPFRKIDGILVTHSHYDHVGGIDDIRPFCQFGEINIYADHTACDGMLQMMPYCFAEHRYPGVPAIQLNRLTKHEPFTIGDLRVLPVEVMHGRLPILGYRITDVNTCHSFAYITDMKTIADEEVPLLDGVQLLIVNALRPQPHHSHQTVDEAVQFARRIAAPQTLLIHSSHDIGRHAEVNAALPAGVQLAYDGQTLEL